MVLIVVHLTAPILRLVSRESENFYEIHRVIAAEIIEFD